MSRRVGSRKGRPFPSGLFQDLNLHAGNELADPLAVFNHVHGDILRRGTLEEAGVASSGSLILSADVENAPEIIRQARLLNPNLRILARCIHLRDVAALRNAGADVVAAGEAEVAVALAEAVKADGEPDDSIMTTAKREAIREHLYHQ